MIIFDEIIFDRCNFDKPSRNGFIDEWSFAPPAKRIVMFDGSLFEEPSSLLEVLHDEFICFFDVHSFEGRYFFGKSAVFVQRYWRIIGGNKLLLNTQLKVIFTKPRCAVYNPSSIRISHERGCYDFKASIFGPRGKEVIKGFIF